MQYYQILLCIHRPFIAGSHLSKGFTRSDRVRLSNKVCFESSLAISKILEMFQSRYSLRCISIQAVGAIFSAALILLFGTLIPNDPYNCKALTRQLSICCNALAEIGTSYKNASRALDLLLNIKRNWTARLVASAGSQRDLPRTNFGNVEPINRDCNCYNAYSGGVPFMPDDTGWDLSNLDNITLRLGYGCFAGVGLHSAGGAVSEDLLGNSSSRNFPV